MSAEGLAGDPQEFLLERDDNTGSWQRADPTTALLERVSTFGWRVMLNDGADAHRVALGYDSEREEYIGRCGCDGYKYHEGPCAHLCALRKADVMEGFAKDTDGNPVKIARIRDEADRQRRARERGERARAAGRHGVER